MILIKLYIKAAEKEISLQEQKKSDRKMQKKQKQEHIKKERNQQKAQLKTGETKGMKRPHDDEEVRCLSYHLWQKVKVVFFVYTCTLYICHFICAMSVTLHSQNWCNHVF